MAIRFILLLCLCNVFLSGFSAEPLNEKEVQQRCREILQERRRIKQLRFSVAASRSDGVDVRIQWWSDGELRRVDSAELAFPANPSQENVTDRRVLSDGKVFANHDRYGAEIDIDDNIDGDFLCAHWLGLIPYPLVFMKHSLDVDRTIVAKCLASEEINATTLEIVGEEFRASVFKERSRPDHKRFLLWSSGNEYMGCGFESPNALQVVIIRQWVRQDGIRFPAKLQVIDRYAGRVRYDESIQLTDIEINRPIEDDIFSLAGLGVQEGDAVTVRDGSLSGNDFDIGIFSNGKVLPSPKRRPASLLTTAVHSRPDATSTSWSRVIFVVANLIIAVALLVAYGRSRIQASAGKDGGGK